MRLLSLVALLSSCALTPPPVEFDGATSGTVAAAARRDVAYVALTDHGQVARVSLDGARVSTVDVGAEPTRIAVGPNRVFVTLRGERAVAALRDNGSRLVVDDVVEVGAEPVGVVVTANGSRVWVAASMSGEVVELDTDTLAVLRRVAVSGEPRWLALDETTDSLYVAGATARQVARVDLLDGELTWFGLPSVIREKADGPVDTLPRFTGDLDIRPGGGELAVPVLYADTATPIGGEGDGEDRDGDGQPDDDGYGGATLDPGMPSRMTSTVVRMPIDGDGALGRGRPVRSVAFVESPESEFGFGTTGSYVSAVRYLPDGEGFVTAVEGAGAVITTGPWSEFEGMGGLTAASGMGVITGPGTRGIAWVGGELVADAAFARQLAIVDLGTGAEGDVAMDFGGMAVPNAGDVISLADEVLPTDVVLGRALFYDAMSPSMTGGSGGVSCATCHFDGRNDGFTWPLEAGPRQTPSLAGKVSETAPVTWTESVATVGDEAQLTSANRMGGHGLSVDQTLAIEAFVDFTRPVDNPARGVADAAVQRGAELFYSEAVGCSACHSGARLTDNGSHDLYGLRGVNTPSLTGIVATAPYLHDGSAPTLRALVERSRDGSMGDTSALTDAQLADLVAYLESL